MGQETEKSWLCLYRNIYQKEKIIIISTRVSKITWIQTVKRTYIRHNIVWLEYKLRARYDRCQVWNEHACLTKESDKNFFARSFKACSLNIPLFFINISYDWNFLASLCRRKMIWWLILCVSPCKVIWKLDGSNVYADTETWNDWSYKSNRHRHQPFWRNRGYPELILGHFPFIWFFFFFLGATFHVNCILFNGQKFLTERMIEAAKWSWHCISSYISNFPAYN